MTAGAVLIEQSLATSGKRTVDPAEEPLVPFRWLEMSDPGFRSGNSFIRILELNG